MSAYTERVHMLVPAADREWANEQAAQMDPDTGGAQTFGVPLSPSGAEPATHYGASTQMTPDTLALLRAELLPARPSCRVYTLGEGWTWEAALEDAGLQQLEEG